MNKELINKYKPEFDHWLKNPDGLLFYDEHHNGWHNLPCDYQWNCTIAEMEEFGKYGYIINDEYSIYRKALAEGKVIEYLGQYSNMWNEVQEPDFNLHPNCYRIKPDKPKFKVGDFVRYIHSTLARALEINNINGNRYYFTNSEMSCLQHELITWTPEPGEWCWFWDEHYTTAILAKFENISNGLFIEHHGNIFEYCEPFIGELPSNLKDK